ncbi:MAG: hypothetical protein M1834_001125 [Cirrosporium novae-zelandiae]|nr:MAG: hypothetical protein M1834_001125 [Cirrosporium novae-zelandiae]
MATGNFHIQPGHLACAFDGYLSAQQARLPKLLGVEQISPRVIRVLGGNPGKFTLQGTNTYIVGTGSSRILIDTGKGFPLWIETIAELLASENITLSHVLCTHWHTDHTGGVPDLVSRYPHLTSSVFKCEPDEGQQPISDGEVFSVEGATIKALFSPGHAYDHMCFILQEENAMFTGDNVLGQGTTVVEELGTFMSTLRIMLGQGCAKGYPGHGSVIPNLTSKISQYLQQRLRREKQVLNAMEKIKKERSSGTFRAKGSVTINDLVRAIHGEKLEPQVYEMVLTPITDEILWKLVADGKVSFEIRGVERKWFLNASGIRMK